MSFAREGLPFIVGFIVVTIVSYTLALTRSSVLLWVVAGVLTLFTLWVAYFFRDPEREGPRGADLVISPADGRVVAITEVDEPAFLHGRAVRISIFMNVLNVHVNRYPVTGTVRYTHYNKGKFMHAASEKASLDNEQMSVGIEVGTRRVLVRQIAGLIARRIVNYAREGEVVDQADRMGLIRFGSRVDLFVPPGTDLRVKIGSITAAGTTVIGGFKR